MGIMDANEMRCKAAACRAFAEAAAGPVARAEWLQAAAQWDKLADEVEAWRARLHEPAGADGVGAD
jgi:hypothetical protein